MEKKSTSALRYQASDLSQLSALIGLTTTTNGIETVNISNKDLTVTISFNDSFDAEAEIKKQLDAVGCHIAPVAVDTYESILEQLTKSNEDSRTALRYSNEARDRYKKYWMEEHDKNDRITERIQAIGTLINSIYPREA